MPAAAGNCPVGSDYLNPATNTLTTLANLGVTSCYFIAANGTDTNNGTSEASPWAHAPGMPNCANACAAVTPSAGTGFIFRGGDTLAATYLNITSGGSNGSPVYYGIDKTWYSGSSWNRPLLAINGALPNVNGNQASQIFLFSSSYVTIDNFEITGATCSTETAQYLFEINGQAAINLTNNYIHAMQPPAGGCGYGTTGDGNAMAVWVLEEVNNFANTCGGFFEYNVVDGTDGSGAKGYMTISGAPNACHTVAYNVVHDICSGFGGNFTSIHDNYIANFGQAIAGTTGAYDCTAGGARGPHVQAARTNGDANIYNNVIHDVSSEAIMVNPKSGGGGSNVYNNVLYHNSGTAIRAGDNGPDTGSLNIFNNSIDCDSYPGNYQNCLQVENGNTLSALLIANEHHAVTNGYAELSGICVSNAPFSQSGCGGAGTLTYSAGNNLFQTESNLAADGYSDSEAFVFQYNATCGNAGCPTVGIGANQTSLGVTSDTPYGVTQQTVGGVVQAVAGRPTNSRQPTGAWDAGAYQFSAGGTPPTPPTGLSAVVQ